MKLNLATTAASLLCNLTGVALGQECFSDNDQKWDTPGDFKVIQTTINRLCNTMTGPYWIDHEICPKTGGRIWASANENNPKDAGHADQVAESHYIQGWIKGDPNKGTC
ncbi:hypothetical protein Daus18300_009826 [Diaporthe australafricana]|uniref:Secreted protein n=1 Tax=Diaporthe australafricana TaxID=127596 RepID=A0ABR3WCJ3_9PEZI